MFEVKFSWICFNANVSLFLPRTDHLNYSMSFFLSLLLKLWFFLCASNIAPCLLFYPHFTSVGMPLLDASCPHLCQIAREAEAAMFHRQVFEDLRRSTPYCKDPAEAIAIGAVEASFKSLASAMIVLTGSGR